MIRHPLEQKFEFLLCTVTFTQGQPGPHPPDACAEALGGEPALGFGCDHLVEIADRLLVRALLQGGGATQAVGLPALGIGCDGSVQIVDGLLHVSLHAMELGPGQEYRIVVCTGLLGTFQEW